MARIVVTTAGTLGDFAPFRALGRRLKARGHEVVMAINPAMLPLAADAGLEALGCGPSFGPAEARRQMALCTNPSAADPASIRQALRRLDLRGPTET